ncbi:MAG: AbrB/MazE/SpoVT family DNA-binding domain-containing protein [Candidatus Thiodiazotropha sp. L084R]
MSAATITSKGQITIPRDVRARLGLRSGDKINFIFEDDDRVSFIPVTKSVTSLKGIVAKPAKAVSIEDMAATVKVRGGRS